MAAKSNKRWVLAILLVVLFPVLAIHVSCVAVIGPGTWGSGMEEKLPALLPGASNPVVQQYAREFAQAQPPDRAAHAEPGNTEPGPDEQARDKTARQGNSGAATVHALEGENTLRGDVFWTDRLEPENLVVIGTHEGRDWVAGQHFYLIEKTAQPAAGAAPAAPTPPARQGHPASNPPVAETAAPLGSPPANTWRNRELDFPRAMILEAPTLMRRGGATYIVVAHWLPWGVPPLQKLSRYLRSYWDATLRPETSLYVYPLPAGPLSYWGPGHTLKPSPDRRKAILLRSGAMAAGYYSMHLWDFEHDRLTTILSLREAEPGAGRSFDYDWSADSQAVHITGATGGLQRRKPQPRSLDLIYLLADGAVYDLAPDKSSSTP